MTSQIIFEVDNAERKHVGVGPAADAAELRPLVEASEESVKRLPPVPEVVAHAPHVRVLRNMRAAGERRVARRERKDDLAARLRDGLAYGLDLKALRLIVRTRNVVDLHEVDAPRGILREDAVVVFLSARLPQDCQSDLLPAPCPDCFATATTHSPVRDTTMFHRA